MFVSLGSKYASVFGCHLGAIKVYIRCFNEGTTIKRTRILRNDDTQQLYAKKQDREDASKHSAIQKQLNSFFPSWEKFKKSENFFHVVTLPPKSLKRFLRKVIS